MSQSDDWTALAVFVQPHGVSGRIKVKSFTDPADDFANHRTLTDESGKAYTLTLTGHAAGMAVVAVEGITDRDQAALLRGKRIGVSRAALAPLARDNQFYTDDLIGMSVYNQAGELFGTVRAVVNYGASDILEILRPTGARELYAFTKANFPVVDVAAKRLVIDPPVTLMVDAPGESA